MRPVRKTRTVQLMKRRGPNAKWTPFELSLLKFIMTLAGSEPVCYKSAVHLFENQTAESIKKRCDCIRDQARRLERQKELAAQQAEPPANPSPVIALPPAGQLHPTLVWAFSSEPEIEPL